MANLEDKLISLGIDLLWVIKKDWGESSDLYNDLYSTIATSSLKTSQDFANEIREVLINYDVWSDRKYRRYWNKIYNFNNDVVSESLKTSYYRNVNFEKVFYAALDRLYPEVFDLNDLQRLTHNVNFRDLLLIVNDSLYDIEDFDDEERLELKNIIKKCAAELLSTVNIDEDMHTYNNEDYYTKAMAAINVLVKSGFWSIADIKEQLDNSDIWFSDIMDEMDIDMYKLSDDEDEFICNKIICAMNDFYNRHINVDEASKCPKDGCIKRKPNGKWGIISAKTGKFWKANYDTKADAEDGLKAYHVNESVNEDDEVYMIIYANDDFSIDDIKRFIVIFDDDIIYEDEYQIEFYTTDAEDIQAELDCHGIEWDIDKNY